jgi:EmrB/QacA subfamily drug resistance transporter
VHTGDPSGSLFYFWSYTEGMTSQQRLVLLVCILASFVAFLDGSVVNVALPAISKDLGGGLATQQWVVDAYLITLGALMLLAGSLADIFGKRKMLLLGLLGFGAASLLCAFAPTSVWLILGRTLQGIAGAFLVPSSLALIISTFSGKAQGKAIGTWTAWTGMAFLFGPLLGGYLVDAWSWRYIFAINVLPIAVTLWLMRRLEHTEHERPDHKLDILGAILCTVGFMTLVYALIEQPHYGWADARIVGSLLTGVVSLIAFVFVERRTAEPMLPLNLFRVRNFFVGNLATTAIYAGLSVATFLIAIFVQQVGGYSALQAGLALLPVTIIMFLLSPRFGALAGRYGARLFMAAGPLVGAAGFLLMTRVGPDINYTTHLLPGVLVFGLGLSMTVAPLTSAVLSSVAATQAGVASAVNNMIARVAGLVAVAALSVLVGGSLSVADFHRALIATSLLMAAGGIVSAIGIRNTATQDETKI